MNFMFRRLLLFIFLAVVFLVGRMVIHKSEYDGWSFDFWKLQGRTTIDAGAGQFHDSDDEMAAIGAALRTIMPDSATGPYLIEERTILYGSKNPTDWRRSSQAIPASSLTARNVESIVLPDSLLALVSRETGTRLIKISKQELRKLSHGHPFDSFGANARKKYGDSAYFVSLSRPGINAFSNVAVVFVSRGSVYGTGGTCLIFLHRKDGRWVPESHPMMRGIA